MTWSIVFHSRISTFDDAGPIPRARGNYKPALLRRDQTEVSKLIK